MKRYWQISPKITQIQKALYRHFPKILFTTVSHIPFIHISLKSPSRASLYLTTHKAFPSLTADPGVASSIPVRSITFVEIDHEIISTVIRVLPLNHSRRVVVSYKRKYVHEVLVNCLFKLDQEKMWLGELTVPP